MVTVTRNNKQGYFVEDHCRCYKPNPKQWHLTHCDLKLMAEIPKVLIMGDDVNEVDMVEEAVSNKAS
jgi:hypothetical protein